MGHKMALRYVVYCFMLASVCGQELPPECHPHPEPKKLICIDTRYFGDLDPTIKSALFALPGKHPELPPISLIEEERELLQNPAMSPGMSPGMNPGQPSVFPSSAPSPYQGMTPEPPMYSPSIAPSLSPYQGMTPEPPMYSPSIEPSLSPYQGMTPEPPMYSPSIAPAPSPYQEMAPGPPRYPADMLPGMPSTMGPPMYPGGLPGGHPGMPTTGPVGIDALISAFKDGPSFNIFPVNNAQGVPEPTVTVSETSEKHYIDQEASLAALQGPVPGPMTAGLRKNALHEKKNSRKHGHVKDSPIGHRKTVMVYHELPPL